MLRFILLSFVFLGWAFYEVSGGTDFAADLMAQKEQVRAEAAAQLAEKQAADRAAREQQNARQPDKTDTPDISDAMVTRAAFDGSSPVLDNTASSTPAATKPDTATAAAQPEAAPPDIRQVTATRVNLRNGPSTQYNVILKLTQGTRVEILQEPGNGWVKLKVAENGRIGWMASRLLQKLEG